MYEGTAAVSPQELEKRAMQGDADAQFAFAMCLKQGRGVRRDKQAAMQWLQKAAQQDHADALFQLGRSAECGSGLPQSDVQAVAYYRRAAQLGQTDAQYAYAVCLNTGIGCAQDAAEADYWMQQAAAGGHPEAAALRAVQPAAAPQQYTKPEPFPPPYDPPYDFAPEPAADSGAGWPVQDAPPLWPAYDTADLAGRAEEPADEPVQPAPPAARNAPAGEGMVHYDAPASPLPELTVYKKPEVPKPLPNASPPAPSRGRGRPAKRKSFKLRDLRGRIGAFFTGLYNRLVPAPEESRRPAKWFRILFVAAGVVFGVVLKNVYSRLDVAARFSDPTILMLYFTLLGAAVGFVMGLLLSRFYCKAEDPLPWYASVLLLPFILAAISGIVLALLTTLFSVVVAVLKAVLGLVAAGLVLLFVISLFS